MEVISTAFRFLTNNRVRSQDETFLISGTFPGPYAADSIEENDRDNPLFSPVICHFPKKQGNSDEP
jgi:hypothetical protein